MAACEVFVITPVIPRIGSFCIVVTVQLFTILFQYCIYGCRPEFVPKTFFACIVICIDSFYHSFLRVSLPGVHDNPAVFDILLECKCFVLNLWKSEHWCLILPRKHD